jgi:hypothetical protein
MNAEPLSDIERARAKRDEREEKHEYLLVAKEATITETLCYLRDEGVSIVDHWKRDDGRWIVKVMRQR